mmetsp:Transcript_27810/g.73464  ORF Transcript_27810/g.73464 Transcript_27810/m.73464 type:complete len:107 (+) Transcript_27810:1012-1332(+)
MMMKEGVFMGMLTVSLPILHMCTRSVRCSCPRGERFASFVGDARGKMFVREEHCQMKDALSPKTEHDKPTTPTTVAQTAQMRLIVALQHPYCMCHEICGWYVPNLS